MKIPFLIAVLGPRFEYGTSRIRGRDADHSTVTFGAILEKYDVKM
jgi:hypothetical protein